MRLKFYFLLLFSILSLSSCISYGLPEAISGYALSVPKRASLAYAPETIALVTKSKTLDSKIAPLGSQFLLGAIPLTSLYFEHGKDYFLEETSLDVLSAGNTRVILTKEDNLKLLSNKTPLKRVYKLNLEKFSMNAWDLIFLRRISAQGRLELQVLEPNASGDFFLKEKTFQKIDLVKYKSQAQGSTLAALSQAAIKDAISKALLKLNFSSNTRIFNVLTESPLPEHSSTKYIYLTPPNTSNISEYFGQTLADSYGFRNWPAYNKNQVSRIIQRGLELGAENAGLKVFSVHGAQGKLGSKANQQYDKNHFGSGLVFSSKVESLLAEKNSATLDIKLSWLLKKPDNLDSIAKIKGTCIVSLKLNDKKDGAWLFALENSSKEIAKRVFSETKVPKGQEFESRNNILKNINCSKL